MVVFSDYSRLVLITGIYSTQIRGINMNEKQLPVRWL